jgi:hypothetical protein
MISIDAPAYRTLWMGGVIHIEANLPLSETAQLLSKGLAISFVEDIGGRYEEFPAWTAEAAGLEFALLGIPEPEYHGPEPIVGYELQIHSEHSVSPRTEEEAAKFHAVEFSEFFARLVEAKTGLKCKASEYPNTV